MITNTSYNELLCTILLEMNDAGSLVHSSYNQSHVNNKVDTHTCACTSVQIGYITSNILIQQVSSKQTLLDIVLNHSLRPTSFV